MSYETPVWDKLLQKIQSTYNINRDQVIALVKEVEPEVIPPTDFSMLSYADMLDLQQKGLLLRGKPIDEFASLVRSFVDAIAPADKQTGARIITRGKLVQVDPKIREICLRLQGNLILQYDVNDPNCSAEVRRLRKVMAKSTEKKLKQYNSKLRDSLLTAYFYMWLHLFPSSDKLENEGWVYFFKVNYTGVPLRKAVDSYLKNFRKIAVEKEKDLGLYILATVHFINQHIDREQGRPFIPKMSTFIKEQDDWYDAVEVLWESGQIENIFSGTALDTGSNNGSSSNTKTF